MAAAPTSKGSRGSAFFGGRTQQELESQKALIPRFFGLARSMAHHRNVLCQVPVVPQVICFRIRLMASAQRGGRISLSFAALFSGWLAATSVSGLAMRPIAAAAGSTIPCVAPAELVHFNLPLRRTAYQLDAGTLLTIVALGSSSTAGAALVLLRKIIRAALRWSSVSFSHLSRRWF
jgi:hypothetical protein